VLSAAAVDASRWELIHFSLWENDTPKTAGDMYEVLHISAPGLERLRG
jgi:hypothetical protein